MRALSFVGCSKNEINTNVKPLKLRVGPDSSNESRVSPSEAKNSKTSVDESPEVVPNHGAIEWIGDSLRAPANPVSDEVSDVSENMALSALDRSRNEIPSYDAGSKRQYPATSEDTPDSLENREGTNSDSGTENIRVGGTTRVQIEQFLDGDGLVGLTRSTAYTESMDYYSIPLRSAWLKGDFGGGKPVEEQHRQLDKQLEEKLARYREESDDVDDIG